MDPERLIQKLEGFGRWSFVGFGAALTLLLMAILQMHVMHKSQVIEWYIAWGLLELLVTPTGLFLLFAKPWRQLPMRDRLDVAYGYLAISWLGCFAFGLQTGSDPRNWTNFFDIGLFVTLIVAAYGALIGLTYWLLRQAEKTRPEEMFP